MRDGDNRETQDLRHQLVPDEYGPLVNPAHRKVYLIGSLRNNKVPMLAALLRKELPEWTVFDDWYAAGPKADDHWRDYEMTRGHTFEQAVEGFAAQSVLAFDKSHLNSCTHAVLVLPAGRSGHLELGYCAGLGKKTFILLDGEYDRWDVMYGFADKVITGWASPGFNDARVAGWNALVKELKR